MRLSYSNRPNRACAVDQIDMAPWSDVIAASHRTAVRYHYRTLRAAGVGISDARYAVKHLLHIGAMTQARG